MKIPIFNTIAMLYICNSMVYGQMSTYRYQSQLQGMQNEWHSLNIPIEVLEKCSQQLSDIRIYNINQNDTVEVPYILKYTKGQTMQTEVDFTTINKSVKQGSFFYTFETLNKATINEINLNFGSSNFDYYVNLQGSNNLKDWFDIAKNYRILSFNNRGEVFSFNKVRFENSKYRYYRLEIPALNDPQVKGASLTAISTFEEEAQFYTPQKCTVKENKNDKSTQIEIAFDHKIAANQLELIFDQTQDYYRNIVVYYLVDSVKTQKGWFQNYAKVVSGVVSSFEKNSFEFDKTFLQKIKVVVSNNDNQPLNFSGAVVKGFVHKILASYDKAGDYYLVYGNKNAQAPSYDLYNFESKIPKTLQPLSLGKTSLMRNAASKTAPLVENKMWLWVVIVVFSAILGWFSIRMLKKN